MTEPQRTLVVDDEGIRHFLLETLMRDGHIVTAVGSGEEALNSLQNSTFDVVLV